MGIVVAALLAVVVGNMVLASGERTLEQAQGRLAGAQSVYLRSLDRFTSFTSPSSVALDAWKEHLVSPTETFTLPAVPLSQWLRPQRISPAPCCALTLDR